MSFKKIFAALSATSFILFSNSGFAADNGYVLTSSVWKQSSIPVCWVNPGANDGSERLWVQRAVERTWARNSQVGFTGWGTCPATNQQNAIRIRIADEGPRVEALGQPIVNIASGMVLNFTFATWSQSCTSSPAMRRSCIESIGVHEFGHALGFAHEQNRPDTPRDTCRAEPQGTNGNVTVGNWDPNSVMNYCNPAYNGFGALSPVDIQTVQAYYKAPLTDSHFSFDADFYLSLYPDLRNAFGYDHQAALNHWNNTGINEGRRASREFDVVFYLNQYPDLKQAFGNNYAAALNHWKTAGINEGRQGSREVNVSYYLNLYGDLRNAFGQNYRAALNHWKSTGLNEGRQASAQFAISNYFNRYADLRAAFQYTNSFSTFKDDNTLGLLHWVSTGVREGRIGN